jgi:CheY-like chemotaxis protein
MNDAATILIVEDNEDDILLMKQAIRAASISNPLQVVEDGREALAYLEGTGKYADRKQYPLPTIVLLDLKLPYMSGHDVLKWIRQQSRFETMVVIVLTSSAEPRDLRQSYASGANSYIIKPPTADQLLDLAKAFRWYWLEYNRSEPPPSQSAP